MKVLLVNTHDILGGAAIAAYRIHRGLQGIGIHSQLFVQKKTSNDPTVLVSHSVFGEKNSAIRARLDWSPVYFYRNREPAFRSPAWLPNPVAKKIRAIDPDIVHLHWICDGFIPVRELRKITKPLVWTFHDMWAMTGGCHYVGDCTKYQEQCGACPILRSQSSCDLSSWVWKRKMRYWQDLDLTIVSPSRWLAQCAKNSSVFKKYTVEVIPNCLDTSRFKPFDKIVARTDLSLPLDKKLILFGAVNAITDTRKGFLLLKEALNLLSASGNGTDTELVIFGDSKNSEHLETTMKVHSLGKILNDARIPLLYSAADVFIAPSIQDNLANTVMESMACGTPVVAFNIGGMPDMIDHKINGYLAKPFECHDLADGISWILKNNELRLLLSESARKKVIHEYESGHIAQKYLKLYEKILDQN
jgi:glycosyltransferase involved in cell wall biosynthesis